MLVVGRGIRNLQKWEKGRNRGYSRREGWSAGDAWWIWRQISWNGGERETTEKW
jgi:hypothetical protein